MNRTAARRRRPAVPPLVATLVLLGCAMAAAQDAAPAAADLAPWLARHAELGRTPDGALQLWFEGAFLYADPATRDLGRRVLEHLTLPFKGDPTWDERPSNQLFASRLRDPAHHHIFRSYARGATPANGYAVDPAAFELRVRSSRADGHGRGWRVLLESSGADSPRPVYLRQGSDSGLWFVDGFANVYVGVRPPLTPGSESYR